jgi:hypothetical protein
VDKAKVAAGGCCCAERCARIPVAGLRNTVILYRWRVINEATWMGTDGLFRPSFVPAPGVDRPQVHRLAAPLVDNARLDNAESTNPGHLQGTCRPQFWEWHAEHQLALRANS